MRISGLPENLLLRAASPATKARGQLRHIVFNAGEQLWQDGSPIAYALFPVRGVVSLRVCADAGKEPDIGMLGCEGYAEIPFLFGADQTRTVAVALTGGEALAMPAELFANYLNDKSFRAAVEQYMRMFCVMLHRISICNRVHTFEKIMIGRLLLLQDRARTESFHLTQDFISKMLGVRKATVSWAALRLQNRGAIRYDRRGKLTIVDRDTLEKQACSCYRAIKMESDALITSLGGF